MTRPWYNKYNKTSNRKHNNSDTENGDYDKEQYKFETNVHSWDLAVTLVTPVKMRGTYPLATGIMVCCSSGRLPVS